MFFGPQKIKEQSARQLESAGDLIANWFELSRL